MNVTLSLPDELIERIAERQASAEDGWLRRAEAIAGYIGGAAVTCLRAGRHQAAADSRPSRRLDPARQQIRA